MRITTNFDQILKRANVYVKKVPKYIESAVFDMVRDATHTVEEKAKWNVSGGIIGGAKSQPRLDGTEGWMAEAIVSNVRKSGKNVIGEVGIPEESPMFVAGEVQEEGYAGIISPTDKRYLMLAEFARDPFKGS